MARARLLLPLLAVPLAGATHCGRPESAACDEALVSVRPVEVDVGGPTFELVVLEGEASVGLPRRIEVTVAAAEPLLVAQVASDAGPPRAALLSAVPGVPLPDGTVVLARDTRRVHVQLSASDALGHLRFYRLGGRQGTLAVYGQVELVHDAPVERCGPPEPVRVLEPAACGNGLVEPGETCDDENATAGDGCSACRLDATAGHGPNDVVARPRSRT